jgi:regulator of sigma E protease
VTVLIFILLLSLLVIIHELGHFLAARWRGVRVEEFGFGYPPRLLKLFRWRGTVFSLNAIPFGGFVKLEGEDAAADEVTSSKSTQTAFYTKSALSRIAVVAAGPIANLLFGMLAFSIVFGTVGVPVSLDDRPRIEAVSTGSPAELAGVQPGTEIVGVKLFDDYIATPKAADVIGFTRLNQGQEVTLVLTGPCEGLVCAEERQEKTVYIRPEAEVPENQGSIGIVFADFIFETGPWYLRLSRGIVYGVQNAVNLGVTIVVAVYDLLRNLVIRGQVPADVAGPIGIVDQASRNQLLSQGWLPSLEFAGMLSINLGIMNALPIPALDGGRLLFILLEKVIGRRRIQNIEGYVHYGGFIVLLGLIVLVSLRDIVRIFAG